MRKLLLLTLTLILFGSLFSFSSFKVTANDSSSFNTDYQYQELVFGAGNQQMIANNTDNFIVADLYDDL